MSEKLGRPCSRSPPRDCLHRRRFEERQDHRGAGLLPPEKGRDPQEEEEGDGQENEQEEQEVEFILEKKKPRTQRNE